MSTANCYLAYSDVNRNNVNIHIYALLFLSYIDLFVYLFIFTVISFIRLFILLLFYLLINLISPISNKGNAAAHVVPTYYSGHDLIKIIEYIKQANKWTCQKNW